MLPSVCCLADARLVRLFPAVGRWGSSGLLAVLATPAAETKKPRNRLLGCVAKRWLAPRKVHAVLDRVKVLQQGRCRQEKPRKEASLCLPHLLAWSDSRPAVLAWASRRSPGRDAPAGQSNLPSAAPGFPRIASRCHMPIWLGLHDSAPPSSSAGLYGLGAISRCAGDPVHLSRPRNQESKKGPITARKRPSHRQTPKTDVIRKTRRACRTLQAPQDDGLPR